MGADFRKTKIFKTWKRRRAAKQDTARKLTTTWSSTQNAASQVIQMTRKSRPRVTQAEIARAMRAAKRAGMYVRVEIEGDKIVLTEIAAPVSKEPDNELDRWRSKRAHEA